MHDATPVPGDVVWIRQRRWRVERTTRDRHVLRFDAAARGRRLTFLAPFDPVWTTAGRSRPRRARPQHVIARLAHLLSRTHDLRLPISAIDATMDLLPYQLEPALAVRAGHQRLLIADAVGLGKTIQAALVVSDVCCTARAARVLIIVPASLCDQWTEELRRRFHVECWRADRPTLDHLSRAGAFGADPWARAGVWIASPDFLKQRHVAAALPLDAWDLVVVDEAHAMCGESDRYDACHAIARRAQRVVLLTATPHSGDEARFQRLLSFGRISNHDAPLTIFRRDRADVGLPRDRRVRWTTVRLSVDETRALAAVEAFERAVLHATGSRDREAALLLLAVFRKRALSTMHALARSVSRRLAWLGDARSSSEPDWVQPGLGFEQDDEEHGEDERRGLTATTGLSPGQERSWLRRLEQLAVRAARTESKVRRLDALLRRTAEPVVVFTEFRDSQGVLAARLARRRSLTVLHGGMSAAERAHALRSFLAGDASVLVATDVAGHGLNLQGRARWVVSLELPWNPVRLEQRIGRVDRIGQRRLPHLTLLVADHGSEAGLLTHLAQRVLSARRSFDAGALHGVVPEEHVVRAALLGGAALDLPADRSPVVRLCRTYVRSARVVARAFERRRLAGRRWRTAEPQGDAPLCTTIDRLPALLRLAPTGLLVFAVPLLDLEDDVVERHLVAIRVTATARDVRRLAESSDLLRSAIADAMARHVWRAGRRAERRDLASLPRQRALAALRREDAIADESQPGLFDRREQRRRAGRALSHQNAAARAAVTDSSPHQRARVRMGRPVLVAALVGR